MKLNPENNKNTEEVINDLNTNPSFLKENDFYSTIFKRKSIRSYDLTSLDTIKEISSYLQALEPMYSDIKTEFKIIGPDDVKRRMMRKAPHYIAAFSEIKEGSSTNIGFMLQQMDLFFSANGLGSCWQGIPKPTKEVLESTDLEFVILMPFGKPNEPLHRKSISEFKRKPLKEITDITGTDEILEAARLAPSATNSQLWFFTGDESLIHAYSTKPGILKRAISMRFIPIDMGIAIYHLKVAAEHFGKKTEIVFDEKAKTNPPSGKEYVASLKID